MDAVFFAFDLR